MIKFTGEHGGRTYIGFGLSEENLKRMEHGMPILVHLDDLGMGDKPFQEVLIFTGKDESTMLEELEKVGAIGQTTVMHVDSPDETGG